LSHPEQQSALASHLEETLRTLTRVASRADRLLADVESGKGGAGKLFQDEQAADDLRAILRAFRDNPVRFLLGR